MTNESKKEMELQDNQDEQQCKELFENIKNIDITDKRIEGIEKSLKDPQPIDDLDINVIDESLKNSLDEAMKLNPNSEQNSINSKSEKEMQDLFINNLRQLPPEKRNEILMNLAKLQQVNPNDRKFGSLDDKYRNSLLKKLHEKRSDLEMKRKTKVNIIKSHEDKKLRMKQMLANLKKSTETQHVHDENCNHDHDTEKSQESNEASKDVSKDESKEETDHT